MIPYNPSSFNSNKTILEQILELKNWLINNPSYQVYSSSESGQTLAYNGYLISALADPTNIGVGDVVVFSNSTLGSVVSVDTDSGVFGCGPCISFKGDTGATGSDGNSFKVSTENYVNDSTAYSRANVEPVHSVQVGDVILFANDYVGYITSVSGVNFYVTRTQSVKGDGLEQIKLTSQTGTLTADELVIAEKESTYVFYETPTLNIDLNYLYQNNLNVYYGTIYLLGNNLYVVQMQITKSTGAYTITSNLKPIKATSIDSETATSGQVLMANGSGGASWQTPSTPSIEGTSIKSTGVTSGQVLQADGSGGASWQTPSGGTFEHYVVVTGTSGTLTQENYDKLTYNDSVFIYNNSGTYQVYQKYDETNTNIRFRFCNIKGNNYVLDFTINKSTRSYSRDSATIQASGLSSTGATNGQVLTADGNGSSSWQTPSGSGPDIVTISGATGTISASDLTKLGNNAIIHNTNAGVYYYKFGDYSGNYYYISHTQSASYLNNALLTINKTTGVYSTSYLVLYDKTTASRVDSTGATSGQVLTADGNGSSSWQNAGGGTTLNKYTFSSLSYDYSNTNLKNILQAKGNISGSISVRMVLPPSLNGTANIVIPIKSIDYNSISTYFTILLTNEFTYNNAQYKAIFHIRNTSIFSVYEIDIYDTDLQTYKGNANIDRINSYSITYYNDTQLH